MFASHVIRGCRPSLASRSRAICWLGQESSVSRGHVDENIQCNDTILQRFLRWQDPKYSIISTPYESAQFAVTKSCSRKVQILKSSLGLVTNVYQSRSTIKSLATSAGSRPSKLNDSLNKGDLTCSPITKKLPYLKSDFKKHWRLHYPLGVMHMEDVYC